MRMTVVLLMILVVSASFAEEKNSPVVRFMNVGDPAPYYFTLSKDKDSPEKTSVTNPVRALRTEAVSEPFTIPAGTYFICGSYDLKSWGFNNEPTRFLPDTDYFILRVKPGEGYKVIKSFRLGSNLSFDLLPKTLDTPERISSWMQANLSYVSKYGQKVGDQEAKKTFELKTGNCFDMAVFSRYMLEQNGYKPQLMVIQLSTNDPKNHVVTVFKKNDSFFTMNNADLVGPFSDYKSIATRHDEKWWRFGIFNDVANAVAFSDPVISEYKK